MKRILLLITLFSLPCLGRAELDDLPSQFALAQPQASRLDNVRILCNRVSEKALFYGIAGLFETTALITRACSTICPPVAKECRLLSDLCHSLAIHASIRVLKTSASFDAPYKSWRLNEMLLSQIRTRTSEEKELLQFLKKRWLAKSSGFHTWLVDWVCPCFGVSVQAHPETGDYYARIPATHISETYKKRMDAWKKKLPQPLDFPLILTRPYKLQDYLPACVTVKKEEGYDKVAARCLFKLKEVGSKVFVDLTELLPDGTSTPDLWQKAWKSFQTRFVQASKEHALNLNELLFVQRMQQEGIGGIRLLPLASFTSEMRTLQEQFVLEWVSRFGLSVNRIELDRGSEEPTSSQGNVALAPLSYSMKKEFSSLLDSIDDSALASHPQKSLMLKATVKLLEGFLDKTSRKDWNRIARSPTKSSVVQLSLFKIREELKILEKAGKRLSFFNVASHIEQIHADLTALLEVFCPFDQEEFAHIYEHLLTCIPKSLRGYTSCALHSSGMASIAGIFKAVEKSCKKTPRILFGENTYYECINTSLAIANATSVLEAQDADFKEVDLLLAQFNPVLKRIDQEPTNYRLENVSSTLRRCLTSAREKPLTVAIDCTIDFINSPHIKKLLGEFQQEIHKGMLNIICYRSGLKYDLFGMDNYCGAPFYMIHNEDDKWDSFDPLLTDPLLQTDRLSANWFCLAYQNAASELDLYRKEIFLNTRELLDKLAGKLTRKEGSSYFIVPIEKEAEAGFVDIKIAGPMHYARGCAFVMGTLLLKCMGGGQPIFCRSSLGFYHPNFTILESDKYTTVRLTLGLDPAQINLIADCLQRIDTLN